MRTCRETIVLMAADILESQHPDIAARLRGVNVANSDGGPYFKIAHHKRGGQAILGRGDLQAISDEELSRVVEPDDERLSVLVEIPARINMHARVSVTFRGDAPGTRR